MKYLTSLISISLLSLAMAPTAMALPLLAESAAQNVGGILTVYPDDKDPNHFYYMPNSSTLARDESSGLPEFSFTYWGLDGQRADDQAGAYMVFSMKLQSNAEQTAALRAFLARGKEVSVLPIQSSTIGLTTTASSGVPLGLFYREFNFAKKAGVAETEVAVNAVLTGLGARVMRSAIESPAVLKTDFCYMVTGLGPNFDATVDVDWDRVYTDFQAHSSGGGLWFKWQVDTEIERLRQNNSVVIKINGGEAKDEEYVKAMAEKIVERLFKPELQMVPVGSGQSQPGWSFSRLSLKYTDKKELKHEHFAFTRRQLVNQEFCVPLVVPEVSRNRDRLVHDVDAYKP